MIVGVLPAIPEEPAEGNTVLFGGRGVSCKRPEVVAGTCPMPTAAADTPGVAVVPLPPNAGENDGEEGNFP